MNLYFKNANKFLWYWVKKGPITNLLIWNIIIIQNQWIKFFNQSYLSEEKITFLMPKFESVIWI